MPPRVKIGSAVGFRSTPVASAAAGRAYADAAIDEGYRAVSELVTS